MDKPPIDLERLKEIQDKKNKPEAPVEIIGTGALGWILTKEGWIKRKPDQSLIDPYYSRRHLINIDDFDEWG